jgi:succinyl-CoA synthetase beta subunit
MEYQGKELFKRSGIPVPRSQHCKTPDDVAAFIEKNPGKWVVKAQVLMGGRGKAGKIKFASTPEEGRKAAEEIMATPMPPNRQNPNGEPINSVLVEETLDKELEAYCAISVDRTTKKPAIIVTKFGGMDVEEVHEKHPESFATFFVDTAIGYSPFIGRELAFKTDLDTRYLKQFPAIVAGMYDLFFRYGAKLVEINPLILTKDGKVIAADSKVELDDDAIFRHPEFKEWEKDLPLDEDEQLAVSAGLGIRNFRRFPGTVGTMANGAGLAMGTMDAVKNAGGEIANFLDVGGGANAEKVRKCYELVVNNTNAKVFFVNIFGGITRGDEVAKGIVEALNTTQSRKIPLVIRLTGTNEKEGRAILKEAGMTPVETMDEGAKRAVELAAGAQ